MCNCGTEALTNITNTRNKNPIRESNSNPVYNKNKTAVSVDVDHPIECLGRLIALEPNDDDHTTVAG